MKRFRDLVITYLTPERKLMLAALVGQLAGQYIASHTPQPEVPISSEDAE